MKEAAAASERALAERCREALDAMQSQKCALEVGANPKCILLGQVIQCRQSARPVLFFSLHASMALIGELLVIRWPVHAERCHCLWQPGSFVQYGEQQGC